MRMITLAAGAAALAAVATLATGSSPGNLTDEQEIRRVVQYYFDGGAAGDSIVLRQAFNLENAHMLYVQDGALVNVPITQYVTRVGTGGPRTAPATDYTRRRVVNIDVEGNAAVAKLEIIRNNQRIVDYMSLLKVNGRWQIVNKIFDRMVVQR